ncbi:hypothetical protein B0H14DRAFT_3154063 [Mycena olivaceomarginata]|nr:hypothetical protein B0H14DRAFT_3154063 [Mycena olivaceomarginata]
MNFDTAPRTLLSDDIEVGGRPLTEITLADAEHIGVVTYYKLVQLKCEVADHKVALAFHPPDVNHSFSCLNENLCSRIWESFWWGGYSKQLFHPDNKKPPASILLELDPTKGLLTQMNKICLQNTMEAIWENNPFNEQELADDAYSKLCAWMDTLYLKDLDRGPIRWELGADVVNIHAFSSGKPIASVHHLEDIIIEVLCRVLIRWGGGADVNSVHAIGDGPPKAPVHLLVDVPEVLCGVWIRWGVSVNVVRVRMFGSRRPETPKRPPYSILGILWFWVGGPIQHDVGTDMVSVHAFDRGGSKAQAHPPEGTLGIVLGIVGIGGIVLEKLWYSVKADLECCRHRVVNGFVVEHGIGIGGVVRPPDAMSGHSGTFNTWGTFQRPEQKTLRELGFPEGLDGWKIEGGRAAFVPRRIKIQEEMKERERERLAKLEEGKAVGV